MQSLVIVGYELINQIRPLISPEKLKTYIFVKIVCTRQGWNGFWITTTPENIFASVNFFTSDVNQQIAQSMVSVHDSYKVKF